MNKNIVERSNNNSNEKLILITTLFLYIIGAATLPFSINQIQILAQQQQNNNVGNNSLSVHTLIQQGVPLLGNISAPVTIIEFGDFQCPFCDRFAKDTEPQINRTYIQTGKVNMAFKHFTIYGPDSITAAIASQCASDQGKFWNFYEMLYKNQGAVNSGWASKDNLKKFASQIAGLDTQKFNSCLDSGKYMSLVQNDLTSATSLGFQGTPAFIIERSDGSNAEILPGAYPFASFAAMIDKKIVHGN